MVSILLIPGILIKNKNGERIFQNIPLFLILTVNYFNIVGNFNYRLAIWTEDVGTILVPYYFKNPTFYANDLWMRISWRTDLASLPTMITTFLYLVFNFKPEIPTFFLFYIQLVLIYFAVFRLALVMTKKREIAWLSTFFAFSATPWDWNIAALVPPMTAVYSQNLALPLIIFAASYFLENRFGLSMVLLGVAGLIHPTLTIGMIAILGLYLLWRSWKTGLSGFQWRKWMLLVLVAGISTFPALLLNWGIQQVPYEDAMNVILRAGHLIPWDLGNGSYYCNYGFYGGVLLISSFFILAVFGVRSFSSRKNITIFLKVVFTGTIILCFVHVISLYLGIAIIARMVLIRSTILLAVFAMPLSISALWEKFTTSSYPTRVVTLFCLLFPSATNFLALILIFVGDLFKQKKKPKLNHLALGLGYLIIILGMFVYKGYLPQLREVFYSVHNYRSSIALNFLGETLFWFIFLLALIPDIKRIVQKIIYSTNNKMLTFEKAGIALTVLGVVLGFTILVIFLKDRFFMKLFFFIMLLLILIFQSMLWGNEKTGIVYSFMYKFGQKVINFSHKIRDTRRRYISSGFHLSLSAILLIAIIISTTLDNSMAIGKSISGEDYQCNFEAQNWAKENTDVNAKFILHYPARYPLLYSWRTLTGRSLVQYYSSIGLYVIDLEIKRYGDELVDFYSVYFSLSADHGYEYNTFPYEEYFSRLDAKGLKQFSKRFGGDYLVQLIETKPYILPIVFQNDCLIIYAINDVP